jgi:hypothetical protein
MRPFLLAAALCLVPLFARAAAPHRLGEISYGVHADVAPDGAVTISAARQLWLADGRELKRENGKWTIIPAPGADKGVPTVKAIDLAVYPARYLDRRIRLVGGDLMSMDRHSAVLSLPGGSATVDLRDVAPDVIKLILQSCDIGSSARVCTAPIVATVQRDDAGRLLLVTPVIAAPSATTVAVH